jgi:hypothetical protein
MMRKIDDHYKKILKGRVIVALHETLGRKPTTEEINTHYKTAEILHATIMPYITYRSEQVR